MLVRLIIPAVRCEAHEGLHAELRNCIHPHEITGKAALPKVGHPLRSDS